MDTAFESTDPFTPDTRHIAVVAAGLSDPSSTSMLAKQLSQATADALAGRGYRAWYIISNCVRLPQRSQTHW